MHTQSTQRMPRGAVACFCWGEEANGTGGDLIDAQLSYRLGLGVGLPNMPANRPADEDDVDDEDDVTMLVVGRMARAAARCAAVA